MMMIHYYFNFRLVVVQTRYIKINTIIVLKPHNSGIFTGVKSTGPQEPMDKEQ